MVEAGLRGELMLVEATGLLRGMTGVVRPVIVWKVLVREAKWMAATLEMLGQMKKMSEFFLVPQANRRVMLDWR